MATVTDSPQSTSATLDDETFDNVNISESSALKSRGVADRQVSWEPQPAQGLGQVPEN
jgi:hypothetical protein